TIAKVKAGIEWSGLLSLESYAMSMAPVEGTLNRVISVARHATTDADKPLWRIAASEPKALKGIHYVPANAVYTANSTTSLDEAWKIVNEAVATFYSPQQGAAFNQKVAMIEMMLGTNITAITGSLDNEILVSLQLSEEKEVTIPQGMSSLSIPEPNLLIGLQTQEPLLEKIILEKLKLAQMPVVESTHGVYTLHTLNLPLPLPVPVQVTLVANGDYLLIGSTQEAVVRALDSQTNKDGLVATPLYQKLLGDAPEKTSAIEFVSPRFMQTYVAVMKQSLGSAQGPEESAIMDMMLGGYDNMCSGGYSLKTPTGIYSKSYADYGGAKPIEMVASAYVGMLSAIAIPSFQKARSNSQDKMCQNNRRILAAAKQQWELENGKTNGTPVTEADITEYIKGGFPALQCPKGGTLTINVIGTAPACSVHGPLH
ncbi:MAG: hypothetical protein KAU94_05085, partial [Verrucomicrobia bacterium]|nr:hypothetical protein [Verrucomicrobiota bacterium]